MFSEVYDLETVSLRYFNVYGEKQNLGGAYATVVGIFLDQLQNDKPLTINGDGEQRRDFTYVGDVVKANILASTSKKVGRGEVINIGSGINISINEVAKMIGDKFEFKKALKEPFANLASIEKAKKLLDWEPKMNLKVGYQSIKMSKRILITGGAGFIAHHVIDKILSTTDWEIITLDRLDFSGNLNRLKEIVSSYPDIEQKRVKVVHHDLKAELNPEICATIGKIDYISHLAAGSHVDRSITYPLEFVMDNVVGTAHILDYARKIDGLERFAYFSTDEVFGPAPPGIYYKENDRYNSTNPYSASKAGAEELVVAFENTYGLPAIVTHT